MRLARMTDYAIRLLMYVAQHPDRLCTIAEVAAAYDISEAHLMKITHQLALDGWLETTRGKGGGMRLARPATEIRIGEVVRTMEPDFFIVECFATGHSCMLHGSCALTGAMDGALRSFMDHLDGITLADVLPARAIAGRPKPLRFQARSKTLAR
ncbi:Rrf2 family transcriptional regulator [Ramlibacter sp. USB13]|uniref:Rrf2 family transcriptional regulator n=1 Tax=Ramlibacter cellulosilyticus TaxID=2764187 RepID=A0A923SCW1_9BURK|nr:Rrf2 family transcriptional regulator [Ramlibacter cellulosilyticus]MBC5784693.1 Rrf2 family transcriptional regulator [Ramlibacter cellulosilyticus]